MIIAIIILVVIFSAIIVTLYTIKNKQDKQTKKIFYIKLEAILTNGKPLEVRRGEAMKLCRMTKGDAPSGAYVALYDFK
jgi:hypothetical protein